MDITIVNRILLFIYTWATTGACKNMYKQTIGCRTQQDISTFYSISYDTAGLSVMEERKRKRQDGF